MAGTKLVYLHQLHIVFNSFRSKDCNKLHTASSDIHNGQKQRFFWLLPSDRLESEQSGGAWALAVIHVIISARPVPFRPVCLAPVIDDGATRKTFIASLRDNLNIINT